MMPSKEPFDIGTLSSYSTIVARVGSIGVVSVLNDRAYVGSMVRQYLSRISGPLSAIQLREIAARMAYGNTLLKSRPQFWTEWKHQKRLTTPLWNSPTGPGETECFFQSVQSSSLPTSATLPARIRYPLLRDSASPLAVTKLVRAFRRCRKSLLPQALPPQ